MPTPIIISGVSGAATSAGTQLSVLRHRLLETLGPFIRGVVTQQAASLEAAARIISEDLLTDAAPATHLDGRYVYVYGPAGGAEVGTQRQVMGGSFDGPLGALSLDRPYDTPLAAGSLFEVAVLPAQKYLGSDGANHCINLALEQLPVPDYLPFTVTATGGVTDSQYAIPAPLWPVRDVDAVVYRRTSTISEPRQEVATPSYEVVRDADQVILSFWSVPGNVGDVLEIKVQRPAVSWIRHDGVWGDAVAGLASEDDACLYGVNEVVAAARPIALQRLSLLAEAGSPERALLVAESEAEYNRAALARWYAGFRGDGRQKARPRGGYGPWGAGQPGWSR
jgi:hypothetical protein